MSGTIDMNNNNGFIVLHRKMLDWQWADDPLTGWLWVRLLLMANHEDKKWHGIVLKRGQLVTTLPELSKQTGLSVKQVRIRLEKLIDNGSVGRQTTNRFSIITICEYECYQNNLNGETTKEGRQRAAKRADRGQPKGRQKADKTSYDTDSYNSSNDKKGRQRADKRAVKGQHNNNNINRINSNEINSSTHTLSAYTCEKIFDDAWDSQEWREAVCARHKMKPPEMEAKWKEFILHRRASDKTNDSIKDIREHFNLWLYGNESITQGFKDNAGGRSPTLEIGKNFKSTFDF